MKDNISIARLALLHPKARAGFQAFIEEIEAAFNATFRIVQGLRTFKEQDALYAQGRTTKGPKVTAAKGGQSYHCYGLAIDIVEIRDGKALFNADYARLKPYADKHGLTWGAAWKDYDHYEMSFGHGPSGWGFFLALHNAGKVDGAGDVLF